MYALQHQCFTFAQTSFYERLLLTADHLIEEDLVDGYFPGQHPSPAFRDHAQHVMSMVYGRARYTRGRTEEESPYTAVHIDEIVEEGLHIEGRLQDENT